MGRHGYTGTDPERRRTCIPHSNSSPKSEWSVGGFAIGINSDDKAQPKKMGELRCPLKMRNDPKLDPVHTMQAMQANAVLLSVHHDRTTF